jgi:hypothetical protein
MAEATRLKLGIRGEYRGLSMKSWPAIWTARVKASTMTVSRW